MIDRLKYHFSGLAPYVADVAGTHAGLSRLMSQLGLDALLVTSQDEFVTEFLPRRNDPRYAVSAFDGSTGNGVFLSERVARELGVPQFVLFVDGRYHLQADAQCDPRRVRVEKLGLGASMWKAIAGWLVAHAARIRNVGYDALRMNVAQREGMVEATSAANFSWTSLAGREVDRAIDLPGWNVDRPIFELPESVTGASVAHNIATLNQHIHAYLGQTDQTDQTYRPNHAEQPVCFLTCVSDDLSYLLNSRGYHIPQASSHLGFLFVIGEQVVLFLPEGCDTCPVALPSVASLQVIRRDMDELARALGAFDVRHVCYSADAVNCALPDAVRRVWPAAVHTDFSPVESMRAAKTPEVLDQFRDAFARSSAAIAETMRWTKSGDAGKRPTEYDLARAINDAYGARGAVGLSFTSIAANGANSASAHYTAASDEVELQEGELVLLDSGAYYDSGFATDCTRVVLRRTDPSTHAQPWQKRIYTVALKACIKGLVTPFPADATGADVDATVREVCRQHDYDFGHGTGHGVGIHVHEGGVRFAPGAAYGLVPGAVVSVEPGIYLPGKGGVRIENIVIIHPSETEADKVRFENIVAVGYDWDLIDLDLLDEAERDYLRDYERWCVERGTQVTACPLL
ncbi:M24 family metallopeptidase [Paraburkholderia sp. D15]|uniref:M24 family metallopeptidase n=1 Tax=Paraburkholderia sp. D15 TaxID=2880218 RepID=UPI002478A12B|nr:M24 family metallopeptidase [Paraburkholderia sp. D15]WGS53452.1 M24 family metallopeptidase [Paraburkholderia sp. D15]